MRSARLARPLAAGIAAGLGAFALAGCVSTTSTKADLPAANTRDRITASDEPDAMRRARARFDLASAYFSRNQMMTALDQVKLALDADPNYAEAYNLRGLIYSNLGDTALAEESFRRSLQLKPRDPDTMHNYGWYLCQQKRYPEAQSFFTQAMAIPQYRGTARTLLTQGICHAYAGQLAEADNTLSRAYELDPGNPFVAVNLSQVLYQRGEYERARFYVRRVNGMTDISNAQTLWLAARIEQKLGNQQGVTQFGTQLQNRFPDSREAAAYARGSFDE
ncbi:type IV pilus biogenesis/stability protein PilW [Piscinibacter koreensis]|uniref:Type IV pilus biogenesis/stability protein PilW n=1 Tax=Piscinibacter koreensis TaxID=2742824 RepID=A0A7Y6NN19_9BURK|nr:type IV pilus biogenesis/stability protein PilW [Schlegelella koreensis]NUZ06190.1 type IV pilus biogenesis/stability protein PilW [Schlegelella koreensis]